MGIRKGCELNCIELLFHQNKLHYREIHTGDKEKFEDDIRNAWTLCDLTKQGNNFKHTIP